MPESSADKSGIKVMIVDDHVFIGEVLASMLTGAGYEVSVATDGESALKLAEQVRPQIVIMDVVMPGMSGIEATARLLALYPDTHILMLSMVHSPEIVRQAMEVGAQGYLTKEVGLDSLLDAMRQIAAGQTVMAPGITSALLQESSSPSRLTRRERQVLTLVASGETSERVARSLALSTRTVENHLARIRAKIGAKNRAQLTRYAIEHHLDL